MLTDLLLTRPVDRSASDRLPCLRISILDLIFYHVNNNDIGFFQEGGKKSYPIMIEVFNDLDWL